MQTSVHYVTFSRHADHQIKTCSFYRLRVDSKIPEDAAAVKQPPSLTLLRRALCVFSPHRSHTLLYKCCGFVKQPEACRVWDVALVLLNQSAVNHFLNGHN